MKRIFIYYIILEILEGKMKKLIVLAIILSLGLVIACSSQSSPAESAIPAVNQPTAPNTILPTTTIASKPFTISIDVLEQNNLIPTKHACHGADVSLPLSWGDPPEGTKSLALIMDDPDAVAVAGYVWIHWLLFNLPTETRSLPEDLPKQGSLADGSLQGKNSFGKIGYGGPCPPKGTHHYVFKLYALDTVLNTSAGTTSGVLTAKMKGHILDQTELVTIYRKH